MAVTKPTELGERALHPQGMSTLGEMLYNIKDVFTRQLDRARICLPVSASEEEVIEKAKELRWKFLHLIGSVITSPDNFDDTPLIKGLDNAYGIANSAVLLLHHNPDMPNGIRHIVKNVLKPKNIDTGLIVSNFGVLNPMLEWCSGAQFFRVGVEKDEVKDAMRFLKQSDPNSKKALLILCDEAEQASSRRTMFVDVLGHSLERPTGPLQMAMLAKSAALPVWFQGLDCGVKVNCGEPFLPQKALLQEQMQQVADFESQMKLLDPFII